MSIFREDNDTIRNMMECSIAYVKFVDNGGCICTFTNDMTNELIDLAMKLKAHRDYIDKYMGREIIQYDKEGSKVTVRSQVSEGEFKADKVRSKRENRQGYNLVS